ncbi:hypothetical protein FB45DRAFT_909840 [Roridomyces roridus]|uniref:Uncharacterized protein n=1 Tax=Roridomyces roridus TaxID=1738132 RepID=A0AAD7BZ36_9AGAR|nr:hypothetical protein FB45DRAFT_909840 [Roridomyces roridus]
MKKMKMKEATATTMIQMAPVTTMTRKPTPTATKSHKRLTLKTLRPLPPMSSTMTTTTNTVQTIGLPGSCSSFLEFSVSRRAKGIRSPRLRTLVSMNFKPRISMLPQLLPTNLAPSQNPLWLNGLPTLVFVLICLPLPERCPAPSSQCPPPPTTRP